MNALEEVSALNDVAFWWSLLPALLVVGILSAFKRRVSYKKQVLNGRPGLLVPVNFLGGNQNRFSISLAFGATAGSCFALFVGSAIGQGRTGWYRIFAKILYVSVYGVIYYPIFACLTTDHKRLGSCMGLLYSVFRFVTTLLLSVKFSAALRASSKPELSHHYSLMDIPVLVCLLCLVARFLVLAVQSFNFGDIFGSSGTERMANHRLKVADAMDTAYVKNIIQSQEQADGPKTRLVQLRDRIYMQRKGFKYPTQIISTLVVASIIIYMLAVLAGLLCNIYFPATKCERLKSSNALQYKICLFRLRLIRGCGFTSIAVAALCSYLLMINFLTCVRKHILRLYKSRKGFISGTVLSPATLVGKSLQYSGYHIAMISWGFIYILVVLFVLTYAVALFIMSESFRKIVGQAVLHFLPVIVFVLFMRMLQLLLTKIVFRKNALPDITITIDNRQVYHIVSFFFFFLTIVTGIWKAVLRFVQLMLLSLVLMPRIDRTFIIEGLHVWDTGYLSYLGHIYTFTAHRHPILLVFCHHLVNSSSSEEMREARQARMSQRAYNRWHLARLLLKNPGLVKERSRSRAQSTVISLRDVNINSPAVASVNVF